MNIPLEKIKNIYFLGIGGIGMSALAHFFLQRGVTVMGYDHTPSDITHNLEKEGAIIRYDTDTSTLPVTIDLIVYTPAIHNDFVLYQYFTNKKIPIYKRSELLGMICKHFPTIAVAGTHGKTSTTALITHLLHPESQILSFIGGIVKNFGSNFILDKNPQTAVVEADEFDKSFLTLFPHIAVITSMDADHLDIYGNLGTLRETFQQFADQTDRDGLLIIHEKIADCIHHPHKTTYGFSETCDYYAKNIQYTHNSCTFDIYRNGQPFYPAITLGISGMHNVLNALAAVIAVSERLKETHNPTEIAHILSKLADFKGVKRRFDIRIDRPDMIYIDDYAHHPEEIKAFLTAIKRIFPNKKSVGIFQPHLYSRTRDFAVQFAEALSLLDFVILMEIYPAREEPIPGISSSYLLNLIPHNHKILLQKDELLPYLQALRPELLLTIGAGDIDRFVPRIEAMFNPTFTT